jgi:hypothetical protein
MALVVSFHEVLSRVAARGESDTAEHAHTAVLLAPGVVFVPVHDAPAAEWVLVWRKDALTRADAGSSR